MNKSKFFKHFAILFFVGICIFFTYKFFRVDKPDLTVVGFVKIEDGLGRQSVELINAFKEEIKVNFITTRNQKKKNVSKNIRKLYMDHSSQWGKVVIFEDMLWTPDAGHYEKITKCDPDSIKFAYSMWESTAIPYEWVMILNQYFDAVLVPSKFLIEVYITSGVTIPVFALPLGLDMGNFLKTPLKQKCGYPMVFGNLSACTDRKNHIALIRAFAKAFGDSPDVRLHINSRFADKLPEKEIAEEIEGLYCNNIIFTQFSLPKDHYLKTFLGIDCYVSPSKGEGFSIQPREAMALGIPVIATNNTGQEEICASGLVKTVESPIKKFAFSHWGKHYGHNFECKIDDLAKAMKEVKEQYDLYLSKGKEAREWARQYQYDNLKVLYRAIISPKSVVLGDKNQITQNCIITDSKPLYEKYKQAFGKTINTNSTL